MTTNKNQPEINFLVTFLNKHDTDKLRNLKRDFKNFTDELEEGVVGGADEDKTIDDEYKFRLEVCKRGLSSIFIKAEKEIEKLRIKLKKLNNVQLFSQIIVVLSGATILSTLQKDFGENYKWVKFIAPSLVLIASILTIWAKNKSESFLIGTKNLYETTGNLISLKNQANFLLSEIAVLENFFNLENVKSVISTGNEVASKMIEEIERL